MKTATFFSPTPLTMPILLKNKDFPYSYKSLSALTFMKLFGVMFFFFWF